MRYWENTVLETDKPPTKEPLQEFGSDGWELVTIVYSENQKKWLSYFKRFIDPLDAEFEKEENTNTDAQNLDDIPF